MTFVDIIQLSTGNLRRMKLRAFLTIAGVLIAIAAFVSMLSFGAGMQQNVVDQFNEMGLFNTMMVYPADFDELGDSTTVPLDDDAVARLSGLENVRLAYPLSAFPVEITLADTTVESEAQGLSLAAMNTKLLSRFAEGGRFSSDSASEAIVTQSLLRQTGLDSLESVLGRRVIVTVNVATIDSAIARVAGYLRREAPRLAREIDRDSVLARNYQRRMMTSELDSLARSFMGGFMQARAQFSDTLEVVGVFKERGGRRTRTRQLVLPAERARRLTAAGFTGEPADLMMALSGSGSVSLFGGEAQTSTYPRVTLDLEPGTNFKPIKDTVEAWGFETFSYAEQFEEISKAFTYFNLALAMIGGIALVTASLGIINTMVMATIERRREIGVMKSLGADERDIRLLFLIESGLIGFVGAIAGIVFGWLISRVASTVAKHFMEQEGADPVELFAVPLWLILIAMTVGVLVSLAAGYFPASRAAHVEPVEALRNE